MPKKSNTKKIIEFKEGNNNGYARLPTEEEQIKRDKAARKLREQVIEVGQEATENKTAEFTKNNADAEKLMEIANSMRQFPMEKTFEKKTTSASQKSSKSRHFTPGCSIFSCFGIKSKAPKDETNETLLAKSNSVQMKNKK